MESTLLLFGSAAAAALAVAALEWRHRSGTTRVAADRDRAGSAIPPTPPDAPTPDDWITVAASAALDALWDWDPLRDTLKLSTRWREIIGMPPEPLRRSSDEWWSRVHPSDRNQLHVDVTTQLSGSNARFSIEHRVRHADGRWLHLQWVGAIRRDETGRAVRVAGSVRDMTAQRSAEERQRRESLYDALTGLPNRSLAIDLLRRAINRTRRQGERRFAVLLVDLDRFNLLNDSLGHGAGDELLKGVARRLGTAIRPGDVIARLGGDEFLLLLDEIHDVEAAESVADRVKLVLAEPIKAISHDVVVSASIGIVLHDPAVDQPTDYLRDAELAMHDAKRQGRARSERFSARMRDGVRHRVSVEQDLRGAVDREEFMVLYQPVWCTRGTPERLLGFEALVRWNHPTKGTLGAGEFVPIAEETDLIISLGSWTLHRACRELLDFAPNGPDAPWVSVNLAAQQLANRALETLRARGVRSLMDDFGTGHASLSYLHRLPIGTIKVDRDFVGRMDVSPECLEIVRSIITLARSLGMDVVAEGVEHDAQLAQLRDLGCQAVQGFLLSRPLHAEEAIALIASLEGSGALDPRAVTRDLGLAGGGVQSVEAAARELAEGARMIEVA
jgi:diguanylate cyclase (GGDEF)-like protein/PAS domain S-box-containing protein